MSFEILLISSVTYYIYGFLFSVAYVLLLFFFFMD